MAGTPQEIGERVAFEVIRQGNSLGNLQIHRPGMHMILNGLAAAAICEHAGVNFGDIRSAANRFQGARRRFELKGEAGGVIVMDDYAHHPAKVRALIESARVRFGGRRIIGVYQPHTYTRTAYLWDDWLTCFGGPRRNGRRRNLRRAGGPTDRPVRCGPGTRDDDIRRRPTLPPSMTPRRWRSKSRASATSFSPSAQAT